MLRRPLTVAVLASAALAASAHAAFPEGGQTASPVAWVKVSSCSRSAHTASFYSRVRHRGAGERMWMRFTLLQRGDDGRYEPVAAPALKRWRKSKPGVRAFGYRQRVRALSPDAAYRMRVDYRWYDADGTLVHKARRRSGVCSQTGPLPNLRARITGSSATGVPSLRRYTVRLANAGAAAALGAKVRFSVEEESSETKTVSYLAAGDSTIVSFHAPPCLSGVKAQADPDHQIAESVETDNDQRLSCDQIPAH
jgi:hypothetical protein